MLIDQAAEWLGWPDASLILDPTGEGASACVRLARQKIGDPLGRQFPSLPIEIGILTADLHSGDTASPLAIVCQFRSGASDEALREAHRLAWNFSRSALLLTLEPHRLMAWSCFQDPKQEDELLRVCELSSDVSADQASQSEQHRVRELLHWVSLITGHVQNQYPDRFPMDGRADALLLKNLRHVRSALIEQGLPQNFCHDLLARIIFTQFLFHRKDSRGNAFFSRSLLSRRCEGALSREHYELSSILADKEEIYALFRWMDDRFNGDLFPGQAYDSFEEREAAWKAEKDAVQPAHLKLLSDLVSGTLDTSDRQLLLWPSYSFDTIPLEFISSVYEEFLNEERDTTKAYYTPSQLVDYVLDSVLPWDGQNWDLQILDPSCGSGIFLVKAFQRLIHRWRRHHKREPLVSDLKPILAGNLFGVDMNSDAVRVACFSLYLAMADAIDPKHYVTRDKVFPRLRGTRLVNADFFNEGIDGIGTESSARKYDLVVGNAPWGEQSINSTSEPIVVETPAVGRRKSRATKVSRAEAWSKQYNWPVTNHDIGPLFVAKGLSLVSETGRVAMVQPAPPWLYQRGAPARALRKRLFCDHTVDEVTNLSALRRDMFAGVIGPSCVLVAGPGAPEPERPFFFFTPKRLPSGDVCIEPSDVHRVSHRDGAHDALVWSVLSLGGERDLRLIRRLGQYPTLAKLENDGKVLTRLGVIPGDEAKSLPQLEGVPYFEDRQFPEGVFLELDASTIDRWDEPRVHDRDSTDFSAFESPQLLIKHSFVSRLGRFRAVTVKPVLQNWGVICKKTYLSVRDMSPDRKHIRAACLAYNSRMATYFLFLTSSRVGHYITEVPSKELLNLPLPDMSADFSSIDSFETVDKIVHEAFSLTEADWTIVEDFLAVGLPSAIRTRPGPGRKPTHRHSRTPENATDLVDFAIIFIRVLRSTFGSDKPVSATVYEEPPGDARLPVRMMTVHLGRSLHPEVTVEPIKATGLLDMLALFHRDVLSNRARSANGGGLGFQRVAFLFNSNETKEGQVQSITIVKPDECRYWTRSQAMRDADELATAILQAAQAVMAVP